MKKLSLLVLENGNSLENLLATAVNTNSVLRNKIEYKVHQKGKPYSGNENPDIILVDWETYGVFVFQLAKDYPQAKIWLQHDPAPRGPNHPHSYPAIAAVDLVIRKDLLDPFFLRNLLMIEQENRP